MTTQQQQQQQQDKLKQLGNNLVQKEEYEQALKFYDRALELDSTSESSAAIFSNRSLCFLNMKKFNNALQDAGKAISLRPTWHRGYQRAAAACEKLEKHEEGLKHLEKCFELDEASRNDAAMKKMKDDFEINIIKQKCPSMTQDELKQIGNNFIKNQQYESAIVVYTLAIEKDAYCDAAVPILSNRSLCYFKIEKYKAAYEDGGCCCGIKPDWAKGFMRRGVAAEKLGKWQIALESYDEYLKLDPKDEAGVKSSRSAVAKVVADLKKEEEARQKELQRIELDLENTADLSERVVKSYALLTEGTKAFDIERMKIALKQPCDIKLDIPCFNRQGSLADIFHPTALESARQLLERSPETKEIITPLAEMFSMFAEKSKLVKIPIARQVEFLDFILDVAEERDFSASNNNFDMRRSLIMICQHDYSSSGLATIRKDLVLTLFNRIDTARKVFHGKKASTKEFASDVLFIMCFNYDRNNPSNPVRFDFDMSSDICSQDLYECICTAVEHKADPNIKTMLGTGDARTLDLAIYHLRSVKVIELLLRNGANPNFFGFMSEIVLDETKGPGSSTTTRCMTPTSALSAAFRTFRPDIIRALLRFGAKLPVEKLPDVVLKCFPPSKYPLVKPQCTSHLVSTLQHLGNPQFSSFATEEYIQLWFEVLSQQNMSFLCRDTSGSIINPLSVAIDSHQSLGVRLIETMIKLKPGLVKQMHLPFPDKRPLTGVSPLGMLVHHAGKPVATTEYLKSVAQVLMDNGADMKKDVAQCYFDPVSDKVDSLYEMASPYTAVALVDHFVARGFGNDNLKMLKTFMMKKK